MLYASYGCASCHGPAGGGLIGPKIGGTALSFNAVLSQLRSPRGQMTPFGPGILSDAQARDIYAFLRTLP